VSRRRKPKVRGKIDYATGQVSLEFPTPPLVGKQIHIDYAIDSGLPEPDVIERIAAIENEKIAARVKRYDDWVAAGKPPKLQTFDMVSDPAVPNAYPKLISR
jgi:hypothetical protein